MDCRKEDVAARYIAEIDAILGFDSGKAVENTLDLQSQLHYAGHHATVSQRVVLKPVNPRPRDLIGGQIPDHAYTPREILGEDFTRPVLEAYGDYQKMVFDELKVNQQKVNLNKFDQYESKIDPETLADFKGLSGLNDAVSEAKSDIDTYFNEPAKAQYASEWLNREIMGQGKKARIEEKGRINLGNLPEDAASNLNKNLLLNNFKAGIQNWTQLTTTTLPEHGLSATLDGYAAYKKAVNEKSPELAKIGGERFMDESSKFDFFSSPEGMNQGVTYFVGKAKALKAGKSESQARFEGNKEVERLQFKFMAGNRPRAMWGGGMTSQLNLASYAIQMRKLHHGWVSDMVSGAISGDMVKFKKAAKSVAIFYVGNALVNGVSSDIPDEARELIKHVYPKEWAKFKQLDKFSLITGAIGVDTSETTSIPISPLGYIAKVPTIWDKTLQVGDRAKRVFEHPDNVKSWIALAKDGSLFLPSIPVVGNKNAGNILELVYRTTFGNYDRYLPGTSKKYQSNKGEEVRRAILGNPSERVQEAADYRASKAN